MQNYYRIISGLVCQNDAEQIYFEKRTMSSQPSYLPLPGSDRTLLPDSRAVGAVQPDEQIQVSIYLNPRSNPSALTEKLSQPEYQPLTQNEFVDQHGADPDAIAKVEAFAGEHQLTIVEVIRLVAWL